MRIARANHPCSRLSRWRKFAFSKKDGEVDWKDQRFEASYNSNTDTYITIELNGHARTVVKSLAFTQDEDAIFPLEYNRKYEMCDYPEEWGDGLFWLRMEDDSCQSLPNPLVHFYTGTVQPANILNLPAVSDGVLEHIDEVKSRGGEYILFDDLSASLCDQLNDVTEEGDSPVFGQLPDGSWLQHDPRIILEGNTPESPIPDGGGLVQSLTGDRTRCANAPRTFLNEEQCTLSDSSTACGSTGTPNLQIELNSDNIIELHSITGRYMFAVLGLPLVDTFGNKQPSPCEPELRSRWEIVDADECTQTTMGAETNASLVELLLERENSDTNPLLRDIIFPQKGKTCEISDIDSLVKVEIIIGSQCFRRVHPEQ